MTSSEELGIPEAPGEDVVVVPESDHDRQIASAKLRAVYDKCVRKGKERAAKMDAVGRAGGARTATQLAALADRKAEFEKSYVSSTLAYKKSVTKQAVRTTWKSASQETSEYLASPNLAEGAILLWNAEREAGERLSNSDILFHQYRLAVSDGGLPRMNYMWTENAGAGEATELYRYMARLNPANDGSVKPGTRAWGSDDYYALLGATNGAAPTYLVLDHSQDLGITGISQIEVGKLTDMTYLFTHD